MSELSDRQRQLLISLGKNKRFSLSASESIDPDIGYLMAKGYAIVAQGQDTLCWEITDKGHRWLAEHDDD